jgi:hypothetical protein
MSSSEPPNEQKFFEPPESERPRLGTRHVPGRRAVFPCQGSRRGGLGGLLQLGIGGLALSRGVTGDCEAKRVFNEINEQAGMAEGRSHQMPFERYAANEEQLRANAAAATNGTTVTGNDDLKSPPAGV